VGMAQVSQAGTGLLYVLDASHRWPNAPVEGGWGPAPGRGGGPGDLRLGGEVALGTCPWKAAVAGVYS
jgi:hypothetical protein